MADRKELMDEVERILSLARDLRDKVEELQSECEDIGDTFCELAADDAVSAARDLEGALDELGDCLQV